jgi:uncharacterized protein (TIGR00297 family)
VTGEVRRAAGYLLVGGMALLTPVLEGQTSRLFAVVGTAVPFAFVAAFALASSDGRIFELFARESDREEGRLYGLASFSLAVVALVVLQFAIGLPVAAFLIAVFVLTTGNLGQAVVSTRTADPFAGTTAFAVAGTVGAAGAVLAAAALGTTAPPGPLLAFVATSGALLGALIRSVLYLRDDSLVLMSTGLLVWVLLGVGHEPPAQRVAVGLAFTVALGYVAYALGTASVTGMVTGVLLALFTVVFGGYGWFVLLVTFFGLGGLSSKFRYEEKLERNIAQDNDGARGSGNVLANSAVALVAVVAFAASDQFGADPRVFQFAFAGAVGAALADTFSSEFGGLFDEPRLITTLERVEPGTDGGVTWQGALAGGVGSGIIAGLSGLFFAFDTVAVAAVLAAGFLGMVVDSLLGATLEDKRLDNQSVNLLATLSAGIAAGVVGLLV